MAQRLLPDMRNECIRTPAANVREHSDDSALAMLACLSALRRRPALVRRVPAMVQCHLQERQPNRLAGSITVERAAWSQRHRFQARNALEVVRTGLEEARKLLEGPETPQHLGSMEPVIDGSLTGRTGGRAGWDVGWRMSRSSRRYDGGLDGDTRQLNAERANTWLSSSRFSKYS